MALPLILGGIALGGSIVKGIKARKRRKKGEKMQREAEAFRKENPFEIPDEILENQQLAKNEAFAEPAIVRALEEQARGEQANNLSAVARYATSGADALAAATGVNNQTASRMRDAQIAGDEVRRSNMRDLYGANNTLADYRNMAWDMNVNMPYLQRMQFAQDMQSSAQAAGDQALTEGINSISQMAVGMSGINEDGDYMMNNPFQGSQLFMGKARRRRIAQPYSLPSQVAPRTGNNFLFDTAFE